MMDSSIVDFCQYFYIYEIKKLSFNLPHVRIIETHHCVNTRQEAFKCRSVFQYVLRRRDYEEYVVSRFVHQIQSKYYVGNISVSI